MAAEPATLKDFRNIWKDETVWVVGSGPRLEMFEPEFFDDKNVLSLNLSAFLYGIKDFIVCSNYSRHNEIISAFCRDHPEYFVITPDCDVCQHDSPPTHPTLGRNITYRPHYPVWKPAEHWPTDPDVILTGGNSSGTGIHLAAYLGAAEIRMIGVDMAVVNGKAAFTKYVGQGQQPAFEGAFNQMRIVANRVRQDFGCEIVRFVGSGWEPVE
jgi:hypothetical protein